MVVQLPQELPPGEYTTWLGLYDAVSAGAARLPIQAADGRTTADEMLEVGKITVLPAVH
jgi:hypothetical protein